MEQDNFKVGEMVYYRSFYAGESDYPALGVVIGKSINFGEMEGIYRVFVFELGKEIEVKDECLEKV